MIQRGAPIEIRPLDALVQCVYVAAGHAEWLRTEILALESLSGEEAPALLSLYAEERDRAARVAKACLDAGVAERQIRLAEEYGTALAELLQGVFADDALALSAAQRAELPGVLRRDLTRLEGRPALSA
jgi:hypothetical protein